MGMTSPGAMPGFLFVRCLCAYVSGLPSILQHYYNFVNYLHEENYCV